MSALHAHDPSGPIRKQLDIIVPRRGADRTIGPMGRAKGRANRLKLL